MSSFCNDTLSKAINLGLIVLPIDKNDINFLTQCSAEQPFYYLSNSSISCIVLQQTRQKALI